jgi:hypothetical protein
VEQVEDLVERVRGLAAGDRDRDRFRELENRIAWNCTRKLPSEGRSAILVRLDEEAYACAWQT